MTPHDLSEVLSRFPGPVALNSSRKKWLIMLAGSALFAAGGVGMIRADESGGWLVLIFFGACAVTAAIVLLPGASRLTLDRDGFEVANLFHRRRSRWADASNFGAVSIPPSNLRVVVYDDKALAGRATAAVNVTITGHNASLNDTYGFAAEELAQLMTKWQERALAQP